MSSTANSIYQTKQGQQWLAFDPRTKILLLIELDILLFLGRSLAYEASVFLFCALILLVGGQNKTALKCAGIFLLFVLTQQLIQPYLANSFVSFVHFIVVVVRKVLPRFHAGKMAGCNNGGQRICGCHVEVQNSSKCHCYHIGDISLLSYDQRGMERHQNSHENAGN